jgi:hypothetical protein
MTATGEAQRLFSPGLFRLIYLGTISTSYQPMYLIPMHTYGTTGYKHIPGSYQRLDEATVGTSCCLLVGHLKPVCGALGMKGKGLIQSRTS